MEFLILLAIVILTGIVSLIRSKLTLEGTICATLIGLIVSLAGFEYFFIMFAFYVSGNIATQFQYDAKLKIIESSRDEKTRTASQVLYKGLFPSFLSLLIYICYGGQLDLGTDNVNRQILQSMYIAFYCFGTADSLASEVGMIGRHPTYLITTLRLIPKGINGGISVKGTQMSVVGGGLIALVSIICWIIRYNVYNVTMSIVIKTLALGCIWGFIGSMIDSVLGATIQESLFDLKRNRVIDRALLTQDNTAVHKYGRDILNNGQVNLIAGITTSIIALVIVLFIH